MRATTAFNRALGVNGAWVKDVEFTDAGLVVSIQARARRHLCPCGWTTSGRYDSSRRRWRHLDAGATRVWLEADIARIDCRGCGRVRTEQVPWARPGARQTRQFEQVIAWLAARMDKSAVATLMRCAWTTIDEAVKRVVAEELDPIDGARLDELARIGMDEISYKRGHQYLTVIADHDSGRVVWVAPDRTQQAVTSFFDALGAERTAALEAVTLDASSVYLPAVREKAPDAQICIDPFHVVKWVNNALDQVYLAPGTVSLTAGTTTLVQAAGRRKVWAKTRTALRTGAENLTPAQRLLVKAVRKDRYRLWRAWELKEAFRDLYRLVDPDDAAAYLKAWCTKALRSKIPGYKTLVLRLRRHFDQIVNAVRLGLSNSRLEGINAKIRVIQRRGYGHPNPASLTAMIYLCIGGIHLDLPARPTQT